MIRKIALVGSILTLSCVSALAAPRQQPRQDTIRSSSAAPKANVDMSGLKFGLGVSTLGGPFATTLTGVFPGVLPIALSAVLDFSETTQLQLLYGIAMGSAGSGTSWDMGGGAFFRYTLFGDRAAGFHLGGGFNMGGTSGYFATTIRPVLGGHWLFADGHLGLSFDVGPSFFIAATDPVTFAFGFGSHGFPLGLNLHYFF
jgi:hypothetical protein